ncbi:hypothetical protein NQ315_000820 [Exocentrus adspersus]|uniref:Nop domain-containing protein n=1 Tax=Exocentrus adspersus TaxID=1586481 RepID=A0AAV8WDH9_9CUCU|nr:hypothetical protein NQ315_000820 [Exocentrus adspersus]
MSRMLAAKAALATRVDALGEDGSFTLGAEHRAKLESRLRILEEGNIKRISGTGKAKAKFEKYHGKSEIKYYPDAADSTLPSVGKKRKRSESEVKDENTEEAAPQEPIKKKKKKIKREVEETAVEIKVEEPEETPKKKKKKIKQEPVEETDIKEVIEAETEAPSSSKKKKKKKQPDQ